MANQLQQAGSQQGSYVPLFTDRFFLGYVTNRNKLRSPLSAYASRYITSNDALVAGKNIEVSNRLTLIRRPGNTAGIASFLYSGNIPDVPDNFYAFHEINGTIRVFVDTPSAVYLWTATAFVLIFTKGAGAGEVFFQGVGNTLFMSDAVEQIEWIDSGFNLLGVANPGNSLSVITNTALTSNVATITAINSFVVGQTVSISGSTSTGGVFNGSFIITSVTPTSFTYALTHADIGSATDTGFASGVFVFGPTGPTTAPTLKVTQSGSNAAQWAASTWFSTMGILIDANGVAQQLVSVNADGTNPSTQFGNSGNGQPAWNQTPGGTTSDGAGSLVWTNYGPVGSWKNNTTFSGDGQAGAGAPVPGSIYDPASGGFYANSFGSPKLSAPNANQRPPFDGIVNRSFKDNQCNWVCYGNALNGQTPNLYIWQKSHAYVLNNNTGIVLEPGPAPRALGIPYANNQVVYEQRVTTAGTSQTTAYAPWGATATPAGVLSQVDGQLQWMSLGSATWAATTQYTAWSHSNNTSFNAVKDTVGCLQVCTQSGTSGASAPWIVWVATTVVAVGKTITDTNGFIQIVTTAGTTNSVHPTWSTTIGATTADTNGAGAGNVVWTNQGYAYGSTTTDGTTGLVWTNVGLAAGAVWTANQSYYYPKGGFAPPSTSDPFGGADILDSNNNVEFTVVTGTSKTAPHPTWAASQFGYTTDNSVVWFNNGAIVSIGITWTVGFSYVYSFKSRSATDQFVNAATAPHGVGDAFGPFNPLSGLPTVLPPPTGSGDGSVSTASPAATILSSNPGGAVITVSGLGSTNPAIDTIEIYRTSDGGATYFLLTDIVAPPPVGGVAQPWVFHDAIPDTATSTSDGLDPLVIAPTSGFNSPPPAGFINITQHLGRIFGSFGSTVFTSNGPLVGNAGQPAGNGFTSFNLGQFWTFPSPVVRLVTTASGLFVFTTSDLYIIAGGPSVGALFQSILVPGLGLSSYNALCVNGNIITLLTADNQCVSLDPNMGISEVGVNIGDKIDAISPTSAYLAFLIQGSRDKGLYVANGSTGWYRCNPNQSPDSAISGPVWSPFATITGGIKAIAAIEYSAGKHALVMGATTSNQPILVRDSSFTYFKDGGTVAGGGGSAYPSNGTIGSIVLAEPGQLAELGFITADFIKVGTSPKVLVLLDEISDTLMNITAASITGSNTTYTFTLADGINPTVGMTITVTGMATSGNNGTFIVTGGNLTTTFIVVNAAGHTESGQVGVGTQFEDLSGFVGSTGIPPQDSPLLYGLSLSPDSIYANRYYFLQSINGKSPHASCCRHLQIQIDYGSADTVENEILSLTIWGAHWSETG